MPDADKTKEINPSIPPDEPPVERFWLQGLKAYPSMLLFVSGAFAGQLNWSWMGFPSTYPKTLHERGLLHHTSFSRCLLGKWRSHV
jgi:hypothetical protein